MTSSESSPAGQAPLIDPRMSIHHSARLAPLSIIGAPSQNPSEPGSIGPDCSIGSFCHIALSAVLLESVTIDHYVRIGDRTRIGQRSRVLYSARVFDDVQIGADCIISGDVPNGVHIGNDVTFMGFVAHSHRNADIPWIDYIEPSPTIHDCSVIGVNALIIGPVSIGPRSYVGAGEIVRHDIPPDSVFLKGSITPLESWKGLITVPKPTTQ